MIEAVLVLFTNPKPGRDADFNDWYTHIHMRDALRFRGSIAAQRFRWSPIQAQDYPAGYGWDYLALYDVFDAERFTREHIDNALTTRMMVSDAIATDRLNDYHYYPLQFRDNDVERRHEGGVILEQINPAPGREAEFRDWYNDRYLPEAARRPGVGSAAFLAFRPHGQLVEFLPEHSHVGIYRIKDDAAIAAWRVSDLLTGADCVDRATLAITCWQPMTGRISEDAVIHTDAAGLAGEEQARARMGDNVLTDRGNELRTH
jgi:hypothetical protein